MYKKMIYFLQGDIFLLNTVPDKIRGWIINKTQLKIHVQMVTGNSD